MKITIQPLDRQSDLYVDAPLHELDWSIHWKVEYYGWCDEGIAPSYRRAVRMAQKSGRRIEALKNVKLRKCDEEE